MVKTEGKEWIWIFFKEIFIYFHNSWTWWKERRNNHCDCIFIIYEAWNHIRPSNRSSLCVSMSKAEKVSPVGFSEIKWKPLKRKKMVWGSGTGIYSVVGNICKKWSKQQSVKRKIRCIPRGLGKTDYGRKVPNAWKKKNGPEI